MKIYITLLLLIFASASYAGSCVWTNYSYTLNGKTVNCSCVQCDYYTSCNCG